MQQDLLFKNIDGKITILANENLSFEKFIEALKNRLERLYIKDDLLKTNIILNIKNIELDSKRILNIFDILSAYENIYIDKIIYNEKINKNIILHERNIRAGEIKMFSNNTLLIGNINKGAKVIVNGNLYVIGRVSGMLEFKNINNKLMSASVDNAYIKICAYEKQIEGIRENIVVKIEKNEIVEEGFIDRRERIYGKSNCSYIR